MCVSDPGSQRYGGIVQEFFRNVCSSRGPGGAPLSGESVQRESLGNLGSLGVSTGFGSIDELKPECMSVTVGGVGVLAGLSGGNDSVTRIVNKRFMRQTAGEEMISIMGGGKETPSTTVAAASVTEVRPVERASFRSHHCRSQLNLIVFSETGYPKKA